MKTDFISLRLDTKTSTTVKKLIELRLVKTKTNAVKFIMKHGIMETTHIIEKKRRKPQDNKEMERGRISSSI